MRNWEQAWLAYQPNEDYRDKNIFRSYYAKEYGNCCKRAEEEISIASKALFGTESEKVSEKEKAGIVLEKNPGLSTGEEGYFIQVSDSQAVIQSAGEKGILYGTFRLLFMASAGESIRGLEIREKPENPFRMLNMWDNIDGTIERGYAGNSFLYEKGEIQITDRTRDFARLMASVGINAIAIKVLAIQTVHLIVADTNCIQIFLRPCGRICLHQSCERLRVYFHFLHERRILTDISKRIRHKIRVQVIAVSERIRHEDRPCSCLAVGVLILDLVGAEFSRRDQKCQKPAGNHYEKDDRISMGRLQLRKVFFC